MVGRIWKEKSVREATKYTSGFSFGYYANDKTYNWKRKVGRKGSLAREDISEFNSGILSLWNILALLLKG